MDNQTGNSEEKIRPIDARRRRFEETHENAMSLIDEEAERRRLKTEKLKALRLRAQES